MHCLAFGAVAWNPVSDPAGIRSREPELMISEHVDTQV